MKNRRSSELQKWDLREMYVGVSNSQDETIPVKFDIINEANKAEQKWWRTEAITAANIMLLPLRIS